MICNDLFQPNDKPHVVAILSILRIAFLPALLLCNTNPRHNLPVMIHSDYIFILLMCFFAFTNGYLANIAMIWAPKWVFFTSIQFLKFHSNVKFVINTIYLKWIL